MNICAFSDMHGDLGFTPPQCDIVLICGDIVPLSVQTRSDGSKRWLKEIFIPWANDLKCDKVAFVGGNHDFFMQDHEDKLRSLLDGQDKIVYLNLNTLEYNGITIYGTPLCKPFGRWAFMTSLEAQDAIYSKEVEKYPSIDIIVSHDAPFGASDILLQRDWPWYDGKHIGNTSLTRFVNKVKPSLLLHGHLHSTNHNEEKIGDTSVYNVSLLNENYSRVYEPLFLTI